MILYPPFTPRYSALGFCFLHCCSCSRCASSSVVRSAAASGSPNEGSSLRAVPMLALRSDPFSLSDISFSLVQEGMLPHLAESHLPGVPPTYAGKKGAYFPTLKLYPSTAAGCASCSFISYWSLDWVSRCLGVTRCILFRRSGIPSTVCVCMYLTGTHHTNSNTACFCCSLLCLLCSLL